MPALVVIGDDGKVIKSKWVDPTTGELRPYDLEKDLELTKRSGEDIFKIVRAMIVTKSADVELAKMERYIVDTEHRVAAGLAIQLYFPYGKVKRVSCSLEEIKAKVAERKKRVDVCVLTIIGEMVGMNQFRHPNPSQLVVYRDFVACAGGTQTRTSHELNSAGGRTPSKNAHMRMATVMSKTYLSTFNDRMKKLADESAEKVPEGSPVYRRAWTLAMFIDNFVVRVAKFKNSLR
jgi:hypothetical protein